MRLSSPLVRTIAATVGVLTLTALTACGSGGDNAADSTGSTAGAPAEIHVTGPLSPPSVPLLRMIETDALGDTDIVFDKWESTDQLTAAVTRGADVAAAPLTTGAVLANKGVGIQLLNVSAWDVMGLVTRDPDIHDIDDLRGKTVNVAMRGSVVDFTLQLVLAAHGITDDVNLVYVDPLHGPEQFLAGQVGTLVTVEPQVTLLLDKDPEARSVTDFTAEWQKLTDSDQPLPSAGTFVSTEFAGKYPETVRKFRDAYAEAAAWVADNPADAGKLAGQQLGMSADIIAAAIPKMSWDVLPAADAEPAVQLYFRTLNSRWPDSTGGSVPDDDFYLQ